MKLKEHKKLKRNIRRVLQKHGCIDEEQDLNHYEQTVYAKQNRLLHDIEALFSGETQKLLREAKDFGGSITLTFQPDLLTIFVNISSKKKQQLTYSLS